jgi:hypothetical protein
LDIVATSPVDGQAYEPSQQAVLDQVLTAAIPEPTTKQLEHEHWETHKQGAGHALCQDVQSLQTAVTEILLVYNRGDREAGLCGKT